MRSVSRTEKNGSNTSSCGTMPTLRRAWAYALTTSFPMTVTRPPVARASPASTLIRVVLPAPLGPSRPKNSPASMSKLTQSSARSVPRAAG
jgi:hypothetical protein